MTKASLEIERDGMLLDVQVEGCWQPPEPASWEHPGDPGGWEDVQAVDLEGFAVELTAEEQRQAEHALAQALEREQARGWEDDRPRRNGRGW